MKTLPSFPLRMVTKPFEDYMIRLLRRLEVELSGKVGVKEDGAVYLGADQPLHLISEDGEVFRLTIDDQGQIVLYSDPPQGTTGTKTEVATGSALSDLEARVTALENNP